MHFSIIVPVYKVEKYLRECIDSILSQKFTDFELILVDDGSPDSCPQICDEYAVQDTHIKVIHKANSGLSSARNVGLLTARGEYVVFVDSDDVLCCDALKNLYNYIKKTSLPDMVIGNIIHWDGKSEQIVVDNRIFINSQRYRTIFEMNEAYAAERVQLPWRAYQSVYNRQFLKKNKLMYEETLIGAEDCDFYLKAIEYVETYELTDIPLVKYRMFREGSIINTPNYFSVIGELKTFAKAFNNVEHYQNKRLMKRYFADRYANIIILINLIENKTDRERCLSFIRTHKPILKCTSYKAKYIVAKALWSILGIERGSSFMLAIKNNFFN